LTSILRRPFVRRLRAVLVGASLAVAATFRADTALGQGGLPVLRDPDLLLRAAPAPDSFSVRFTTSQGTFLVLVRRALAPVGVDRFHALVRHGFFDGQRFFRVREGFIAQFGLHPDPAVIAAWKPRTMSDDPPAAKNRRGWMAYAFTTAGTRSTQIFINLADNAQLDAEPFAPFAEIIEGLDVIDRLYAGYGETAGGGMRGGKQGPIEAEGNRYFERLFPKLDYIRSARLVDR
jgi:homoserine O-acetyltransferase